MSRNPLREYLRACENQQDNRVGPIFVLKKFADSKENSIQPEKTEFSLCDYCQYTDGIVSSLSSKIIESMNNKIEFGKGSYSRYSWGLVVNGEKGRLKREIVAKSVKEAKFNLVEWDDRIPKDDNWLKTLLTKALQKTPSVILVSCDELKSTDPNEQGRKIVTLITEELLKSVKKEVILIITSEEPNCVPSNWKILYKSFFVHPPTKIERKAIVKKILEVQERKKDTPNRISNRVVCNIANKTKKLSIRELCSAVLNEYDEFLKEDVGNMRPKNKSSDISEVSWNSVQGYEATKSTLKSEIELYLREPEKHSFRGLLLFGPPGCSKTLFVRALVAESRFSLVTVKSSDYLSMYVGETEKNLRALFRTALNKAPCVLFIDELDGLCQARNSTESHGHLVSEIKGLMDKCVINGIQRVFLIGATNRPSLIDDALLKTSFFSRVIHIDLPSCEDRCAMWQHKIDNTPTRGAMNAMALCEASKGFSGAEIHAAYSSAVMKMKRMRYEPALNAHLKSLGLPLLLADMVEQPQSVIDCFYVTQEELLQSIQSLVPRTDATFLREARDFSNRYRGLPLVEQN